MQVSTFKELVRDLCPEIPQLLRKVKLEVVPFYGELYNNTYNQQDLLNSQQAFIDTIDKYKPKKCLETFSGNAVESYDLAIRYPKINFEAIDYADYFTKFRKSNLKYIKGSCYNTEYKHGEYDYIYAGQLNASNCCIDTTRNWYNYFGFCKNNLKPNGIMSLSYFDEGGTEALAYDVSDNTIDAIHGKYKGCKVRWISVNKKTSLNSSHTYYDLAIITNKKGKVVRALLCTKGGTFYSTHTSTVLDIAREYDFSLIGNPEERFVLFKNNA